MPVPIFARLTIPSFTLRVFRDSRDPGTFAYLSLFVALPPRFIHNAIPRRDYVKGGAKSC